MSEKAIQDQGKDEELSNESVERKLTQQMSEHLSICALGLLCSEWANGVVLFNPLYLPVPKASMELVRQGSVSRSVVAKVCGIGGEKNETYSQ